MSSTQALMISSQDFAILAPNWQAGLSASHCLPKSLKNIDVERVNIEETCEKLCLALDENMKYIRNKSQNLDDNENQCAIKKSDSSFRDFSNIWFGTLKIYQQQVNTLFRLSQDLLFRSGSYTEKRGESRKRNSSQMSHKLIKKRRLTLNKYSKEICLTTDYTNLLDDLEKLAKESTSLKLPEETQNVTGSITQYQIREITLREVTAQTINHADELDDDSGFGEATREEIAEFFNFVGDQDILNMKRIRSKRKSTLVQESLIKKSCFMKDNFAEPMNNENIPFDEKLLKVSPSKRSISPTHEDTSNIDSKDVLTDFNNNGTLKTDKIKNENIVSYIENSSIYYEKNKSRKLIIDACIKIDMLDVIAAMKNSEFFTKHIRKRTLKSLRAKRNISAFELLTRFNRRSLKLSLSLKRKLFISREQFERDYLSLLREIFKNKYREEWASKIYPKWISFGNEKLKQNEKQHLNKPKHRKTYHIQSEICITSLANDDYLGEIPTLGINNSKNDLLNTSIYDEWCPYGIMLKLLNLWRSNQANKIAAYTLFKLANNQIDRGLGFNSLLHLSKQRFVNLITYPGSIELQNIEAGNNTVKFYI